MRGNPEMKCVCMAIEFGYELLSPEDSEIYYESSRFDGRPLDISGTLDDFNQKIRSYSEGGLSQKFISLVKFARDKGAKWVHFT